MEHAINQRVADLIKALGLNGNQFASKLGMEKPSTIYAILKDQYKTSLDVLEAIAKSFPQVSRDWLLTGEGPMFRQVADALTERKIIDDHPYVQRLKKELELERNLASTKLEQKEEDLETLKLKLQEAEEKMKALRQGKISPDAI